MFDHPGSTFPVSRSASVCRPRQGAAASACILVFAAFMVAWPVAAQRSDDAGWNDGRAVSLMAMARERRQRPLADTALQNYQGRAEGLVYFYLDRRDVEERILVRTDQVALEVFWAQPDRTKQRIVGMRAQSSLPNRMYYHLDHLTVVQNGFGDIMRMGDGDEVRDVPHPAAPGAAAFYDFRLVDSLALRLPGAAEPVKAYEINVRPKRSDQPAFVGSVFVDHLTGDIVRMTFTFTPVSYVDRRLDFINISLDNSLWQGRYWLPYEQTVEIRRQVPELDFVVTSVIQGRFRVRDYRFNQELDENLFWGYPVTALPKAQREAYEFDGGIYRDLQETGLAPPPEMRDIRIRAAALIRDRALGGLPRVRWSLPNASSALRFNRSEGVYVGWGGSRARGAAPRLEALGGYAFGAGHGVGTFGVRRALGEATAGRAELFANELRDIGVRPGVPGALNTLASIWGDDYLDPFFASGARVAVEHRLAPGWRLGVGVSAERHRTAGLEATPPLSDAPFRAVRTTAAGTQLGANVQLEHRSASGTGLEWGGRLALAGGAFEAEAFAIPSIDIDVRRTMADQRSEGVLQGAAGIALGRVRPQHLFLLGGRETVPGFAYRSMGGDAFALLRAEARRQLAHPFVSGRLTATTGWADALSDDAEAFAAAWGLDRTGDVRASLGLGIGLGWDLLRIDLVRGLGRAGEWQLLFSIDARLWPML